MTGSNQILTDRQVKESLAGRASFFDLATLSVSEILAGRKTTLQDILFRGGWPELQADPMKPAKKYLNDYINSYVERDVVLAAGISKQLEFLKFVRLLAGRTGQIINAASLAKEIGVDAKTARDWISVLERMQIVALVEPYSSNLSSRLVKSPKVYFLDTGLACRLQGWTSPEPVLTSPQLGPLFETLVYGELHKMIFNHQLDWKVYHWRSRAGEEVDFLIHKGPNAFQFVEVKTSAQSVRDISEFPEVRKVFGAKKKPNQTAIPALLQVHMEGDRILEQRHGQQVPIALLKSVLAN